LIVAVTEIRKCIYCLREYLHSRKKQLSHFTREHVIHVGLTSAVENNLTLIGMVCADCNGKFGDEIDQRLLRSGYIGMIRFDTGQKSVCKFGEYDQRSLVLTARRTDDPALNGLPVRKRIKNGVLVSEFVPVLLMQTEHGWQGITEEQIDTGDVPNLGSTEVSCQFVCDPDDEPRIREKLKRYYRENESECREKVHGTTPVFGDGELGEVEIRALTKIAFNYLSYICFEKLKRPEIPFLACFHEVRNFIGFGVIPDQNPLSESKRDAQPQDGLTEPPPRYGHSISIQQQPNGTSSYRVVCTLNLFNSITWLIVLAYNAPLEADTLNHSHAWDLKEGKCTAGNPSI
jgi:hypothetical protein